MQHDEIKAKIKLTRIPRKTLAARLRLPYSTFCSKLNGFGNLTSNEEHVLLDILNCAEIAQKELNAKLSEKELSYDQR